MNGTERLDRVLANMGVGTRSEVRGMIRGGRVRLDGSVCREPETKLDPASALLEVDGRRVEYRRFFYLMMNKKAGYLSATEDTRLPTFADLLREEHRRLGLFPAGRLDRDAEGLLLLTNDGHAAHGLTAPGRHVDKRYLVRYEGTLAADAEQRFQAGLVLDDGLVCRPARLLRLGDCAAEVTVSEGKFHQVKRMLAAAGGSVVYLKRLSIGPLCLDASLLPGDYRPLTDQEERALLCAAGTPAGADPDGV